MALADVLAKLKGGTGQPGINQTATAQHTATAAETSFTAVNATLPNGMTAMPKKLKASGSIGGIVRFTFGNGATYDIAVAPNQMPVEKDLPATAFPAPTNSVSISFEAAAAGTLYGIVEF